MEKSKMETMCGELFFKNLDNIRNLNVQCEPEIREGEPKIIVSARVKRLIPEK